MRASSRPETALLGNFVVRLRIPLCGVLEYASAEILVFLELAQKSLVSESRTAQFPPEFLDGNGLSEDFGLGLDLDPPAGIKKTLHYNKGCGRIDVTEELAVSPTDRIPIGRVDRVHSCPNHVFTRPTEGLDRLENDLEASCGLHVRVTRDRFAVAVDGRRSGD